MHQRCAAVVVEQRVECRTHFGQGLYPDFGAPGLAARHGLVEAQDGGVLERFAALLEAPKCSLRALACCGMRGSLQGTYRASDRKRLRSTTGNT